MHTYFLINLRDLVLRFVLERHFGGGELDILLEMVLWDGNVLKKDVVLM